MRAVAITGAGIVSPIGIGCERFFDNLIRARTGIGALSLGFADRLRFPIAAQVRDFDPATQPRPEALSGLDRCAQFALVAAREAVARSSLDESRLQGSRTGVWLGTGMGGAQTVETGYEALFQRGEKRLPPLTVVASMANAAAAHIAIETGARGPCLTYSVACASSAIAIGEAARAVACGAVDVALAGGSEALLTYGVMKAWEALMVLAVPDRELPQTSCRPFAKDRSGLVLGEGAGIVVIESLDSAQKRGARPLAELVGYGLSNDGSHLSRPDVVGQTLAMRQALDDAATRGLSEATIGYINAHGTGTKIGDMVETESIKACFGPAAAAIPVSATKALHGHLMGAGGALEFIAAVMALEQRVLPPTAHLWQADPACDLDYVPLQARPAPELEAVMSNSFAFGGANAVLVARRPAP